MPRHNLIKIAIISGAALLSLLVYFTPKKAPDVVSKTQADESSFQGFDNLIREAKKRIPLADIDNLQRLEKQTATSVDAYDSVSKIWDNLKHPEIAAYYFEQKAQKNNSEQNFLNAAYRYFDGFKVAPDSLMRSFFVQKAIANYEKVIEINPKNLNARTDLGICYAEGTSNPMKGIMLLRDVVKENPNHENAQLNLGFLSVKSGQYDKAIDRFNSVLKINPQHIEVYVILGQTYAQTGNKEKAIENFEKFKELSNDNQLIAEVDRYISELKK
jgi:tetratricopeptide (TPR) repeat protein